MNVIIADQQDITRAGLLYIMSKMKDIDCCLAADKTELLHLLNEEPQSVVIMDYTLFDLKDENELLIIGQRFPNSMLILWSEDLSVPFVRLLINTSSVISILLKESSLYEIRQCISEAMRGQRYICQQMTEMLLAPVSSSDFQQVDLTKTETEILKDIAKGVTTREIAERRFSSFHTVNTHRKNIFRKLGVNNVHEATKYAIRAGLVDTAEYYI